MLIAKRIEESTKKGFTLIGMEYVKKSNRVSESVLVVVKGFVFSLRTGKRKN